MMGLTIKSTRPGEPVHGARVIKATLAGRKTQYVKESTTGSVSFTIAAGGNTSVNNNLNLWSEELETPARNASNIVAPEDCVAWYTADVYVDTYDDTHYLGESTLTAGQRKIYISTLPERTPATYSGVVPHSATTLLLFSNQDTASHVIYIDVTYKFISFGDENL
jgi:hypothetical protein